MRKTKGGVRILTPPFVFAESAAIPSRMGIGKLCIFYICRKAGTLRTEECLYMHGREHEKAS